MRYHSNCLGALSLIASFFVAGGCSTSTTPNTNNAATPSGTIYFEESVIGIETLDLSNGTVTTVAAGEMPNVRADKWILGVVANDLAFLSPDGAQKQVILARGVSDARSYDASFKDPQLSPNGRYIAYGQRFYDIVYVVDAATGAKVLQIGDIDKNYYYSHPSWGKDGSLYVHAVPFGAIQSAGGIYRIDPTFTSNNAVGKNLNNPTKPTVSPDGNTIAFIMNNHVWTMDLNGNGAKQLTTSDWKEDYPTWSPDNQWIAINNDACNLYLIPVGGGIAISLQDKFPNVIGGAFGHCPSSGAQMDWK